MVPIDPTSVFFPTYRLTSTLYLETLRESYHILYPSSCPSRLPGHHSSCGLSSLWPLSWPIFHPFLPWCLLEPKVTHQQRALYPHPPFWMLLHLLVLTAGWLSPEDTSVPAAHSRSDCFLPLSPHSTGPRCTIGPLWSSLPFPDHSSPCLLLSIQGRVSPMSSVHDTHQSSWLMSSTNLLHSPRILEISAPGLCHSLRHHCHN